MTTLEQYELVRVKCLLHSGREYDGWRLNKRPPVVGDVGRLLDVSHVDGLPDRYIVEGRGASGETLWLSDLEADELEPCGRLEKGPIVELTWCICDPVVCFW